MPLFVKARSFLRNLFLSRGVEVDLDQEIHSHLEMLIEENIRAGMPPKEAKRAATIELGGIEQVKEQVRRARIGGWLNSVASDCRYGLRQLRKNPGFTAVAVLTLALGIGASTSIFSVVDAVLLRPLPYPNPGMIVTVWEQEANGHRAHLADPNFLDFRAQNHTLSALATFSDDLASVSGGSEPLRMKIAYVSQDFFNVLGVEPFRGRAFAPEELVANGAPAMIVSYGYWRRFLGGMDDLSDIRLSMNGAAYRVIGVMPQGFDFPLGALAWMARERLGWSTSRSSHGGVGIGRLRDGVTVEQAYVDLDTIARRINAEFGKGEVSDYFLSDAAVVPFADTVVGDIRAALLTLLSAVGLLLLVACANVAGLLLARTSSRRKELAVRVALGARRGRLIQQFLAESLALSFVAGALGVLLATWAVRMLPAILPADLPRQQGIAVNTPVLLFALIVTGAVAVSLGLFAALRAYAGDLQEALSAGSRSYSGMRNTQRLRGFLVVGEIATTLVILAGSGLLGRSFLRLVSTSPGFREENLITMEFSSPVLQGLGKADASAIARQIHVMDDIVSRLRAIPGAETVGLAGAVPVAQGNNLNDGVFLVLHGEKSPTNFEEFGRMARNPSQTGQALYCAASDDYFRTLGIPLIRGRLFGEQDGLNSPHVAVISQSLARQRWLNQDPIGQEINFGNMDGNLKPLTIVGIVGDVRAEGLDRPASPVIYVDYRQRGMNANSSPTVLVRSAAPVGEVVPAAHRIFHDLAPDIPVKFSTFAQEMGGWLAERRFLVLLVGLFAAAALVLSAVGLYGVVAFSVTRRTQEIGVRMSLGAQGSDVLRLVLGEGARMTALGVVIGIVASLAITRLMSSLLFGVSATDPLTFAGVAILLSAVSLLASYIPARRAIRVDPVIALRYE